ncbi:hypothetical protein PRZ48_008835 [Zasmidium cellare]|uniref:2,5-diamino-6-ribosylamino-4(3H)-pyrimidinone 5'-phosphate reductase n=1 Tax=Zasmidium cellare TaxID=395010 RepID=A0ABR0EHD0_ZASCE|nr:hypothetical protein PRZ48_008835 [Zasmidium cellare]
MSPLKRLSTLVFRRSARPELSKGLRAFRTTSRARTLLLLADWLDGVVAFAPGQRTTISGPETKSMTHFLRYQYDAILVGAGTAVADDPALNCRYPGATLDDQPRSVVVDPKVAFLRMCFSNVGKSRAVDWFESLPNNLTSSHIEPPGEGNTVKEDANKPKPSATAMGLSDSYMNSDFELIAPSAPITPAYDPSYIPVAMSPPRYPFGHGFLPRLPAGPAV